MKTTLSFLAISGTLVLASCGQTHIPTPETNTPDTRTESPSEQTVVQPTNTPSPVDTSTPPTPVVPSPEPQPTPTLTPTSTSDANVFYHTDFSRDDGHWVIDTEVRDDAMGVSGLENGRMWIAANSTDGWYSLPMIQGLETFTSGKNFSFETKFKIMKATDRVEVTSPVGWILFDVVYDANNNVQEVRFFIINTETGEYGIFSSAPSFWAQANSMVDRKKSDVINKWEADNILKIEWRDGTMDFFINGTKVHSMEHRHPVLMGLDIGALMGGGFDYVTITPLK